MTKKMPEGVKNDPILSYFWRRIYYYDQNILMIVCGGTGTCKSGSAITIADLMDRSGTGERRFYIDRVVFKADEFVKLVNSDLPKGSVIIWDETGVEHDSRNYFTQKNKLIKYVMQTFRYKNFMLIMTVPDLKSVDIGARRLLHCYLEMQGPMPQKNMALGFMRFVQVNPRTGKDYFKMPRFIHSDKKIAIQTYYVPKPLQDLEIPYKRKKIKATEKWYSEFNAQMEYMESVLGGRQADKKAAKLSINDLSKKVLEDAAASYDPDKKKFIGALIESYLDEEHRIIIGRNKAYNVAQLLNLKLNRKEIDIETTKQKEASIQ